MGKRIEKIEKIPRNVKILENKPTNVRISNAMSPLKVLKYVYFKSNGKFAYFFCGYENCRFLTSFFILVYKWEIFIIWSSSWQFKR